MLVFSLPGDEFRHLEKIPPLNTERNPSNLHLAVVACTRGKKIEDNQRAVEFCPM
jgi:hypothetical protein